MWTLSGLSVVWVFLKMLYWIGPSDWLPVSDVTRWLLVVTPPHHGEKTLLTPATVLWGKLTQREARQHVFLTITDDRKKHGLCSPSKEWDFTPVEGVQVSRGLTHEWELWEDGEGDQPEDRSSRGILQSQNRAVVTKRQKAKLSVYRAIFVPTLVYGHEVWFMTECKRSRVEAAEISFLRRWLAQRLGEKFSHPREKAAPTLGKEPA